MALLKLKLELYHFIQLKEPFPGPQNGLMVNDTNWEVTNRI